MTKFIDKYLNTIGIKQSFPTFLSRVVLILTLLLSGGSDVWGQEEVSIIENFSYVWDGGTESCSYDGNVLTYNSKSWGGLAGSFSNSNWSDYAKVVFEFSDATTVNTQIVIQRNNGASDIKAWGMSALQNWNVI